MTLPVTTVTAKKLAIRVALIFAAGVLVANVSTLNAGAVAAPPTLSEIVAQDSEVSDLEDSLDLATTAAPVQAVEANEASTTNPTVTFVKAVCARFQEVKQNENDPKKHPEVSNHVVGSGHSDVLNNSSNSTPVKASEVPSSCTQVPWSFKIGTSYTQADSEDGVMSQVTGNARTVSTGVQMLTDAETAVLADDGKLWVQEVMQDGYGFAALRCHEDSTNADNLERLQFDPSEVSNVVCVAYNVQPRITITNRVKGQFAPPAIEKFDFKLTCKSSENYSLAADGTSTPLWVHQDQECTVEETNDRGASMVDLSIENAKDVVKSPNNKSATFKAGESMPISIKFTNYFETPVTTVPVGQEGTSSTSSSTSSSTTTVAVGQQQVTTTTAKTVQGVVVTKQSNTGSLARTGSEITTMTWIASLMIVIGTALIVSVRKTGLLRLPRHAK